MNDDNDDKIEDKILDAYMQTFDLVDFDQSGEIDKEELMQWLTMYVLITCIHESWILIVFTRKKMVFYVENINCISKIYFDS